MKEILKFRIQDIEYCVFKHQSSFLCGKRIKNKLFGVDLKERNLIQQVVRKIFSTQKITFLECLYRKEKTFVHFVNASGFSFFYQLKNNSYKIPSLEDQEELNYLFNHQSCYLASTSVGKEKIANCFERIVRVGKLVLVVSIACCCTFLLKGDQIVLDDTINDEVIDVENLENALKETDVENAFPQVNEALTDASVQAPSFETEVLEQLSLEDIQLLLNSNNKLSFEEKALFLMSPDLFLDNLSFYDTKTLVDRLTNLYVIYEPGFSEDGSQAKFFHEGPYKNAMVVYGAKDFQSANHRMMHHEFCHSLTNYDGMDYGVGLYEILNVMMNNEYFGAAAGVYPNDLYDRTYSWLRNEMYFLSEILDVDVLRKYHANANPKIIMDALMEIVPNEEMARRFFADFDFINLYHRNLLSESEDYTLTYEEKRRDLLELLTFYYQTKYQKTVQDNLVLMFYLDPEGVLSSVKESVKMDQYSKEEFEHLTHVSRYKNYLNNSYMEGNDLVLDVCTKMDAEYAYYSLETLLEDPDGFATEEEIPYPKAENGMYEVVYYLPSSYEKVSLENGMDDLKLMLVNDN